jgi:hypothetical protein
VRGEGRAPEARQMLLEVKRRCDGQWGNNQSLGETGSRGVAVCAREASRYGQEADKCASEDGQVRWCEHGAQV